RVEPAGGPPAVLRGVVELSPAVGIAPQVARNVTVHLLPGAAGLTAAPVLAVRAARRAVLANPDHYEPYLRLGQAYQVLATDPELGWLQRRAAPNLATAGMPARHPADASLVPPQLHQPFLA